MKVWCVVGVTATGVAGLSATDMAVAEFVLLLLSLRSAAELCFFVVSPSQPCRQTAHIGHTVHKT